MKLNGNYIVQRSLGTAITISDLDTDATLASIRDLNDLTCQALFGAIVSGISNGGGTLFDEQADHYIVGSMEQLLPG